MPNFPAGFEDLSWSQLDTNLTITNAVRTSFFGGTQDLYNISYSLLPAFLALQLQNLNGAAGDELRFGISWSDDGTNWKDVGAGGSPLNIIDVITVPTDLILTQSEIYSVRVNARYFRFDLSGEGNSANITGVNTFWAPVFMSTHEA